MALNGDAIVQQINVLATKTSENAEMIYKAIPALNKGLNPEYFSGNDTKIVNAINKLAVEVDMLNDALVSMITRVNSILSDTGTAENKEDWEETKELMGVDNLIDGIKSILEGKQQEKIFQLDKADVGKLLSIEKNKNTGALEVKPTSIESLTVEVGSYDVAYANRDFKELSSVGEAIDVILDDMIQPKEWSDLVNVPKLADDLVIEEDSLVLKSTEDEDLANVPITTDDDINGIIGSLDL